MSHKSKPKTQSKKREEKGWEAAGQDLTYNNLSLGSVLDWIKDKEFSGVHLANCKLKENLRKFTRPNSLSFWDLSDNFLMNNISGFFTNMSNLQKLKLSHNQLKFNILEIKLPDVISSVELKWNQLSGFLSRILNNKTINFLEILNISNFRQNPETH
jgi:hypothetical protein